MSTNIKILNARTNESLSTSIDRNSISTYDVPKSDNLSKIKDYFQNKTSTNAILQFPTDVSSKYHMKLYMGEYNRTSSTQNPIISNKAMVVLPMPAAIHDTHKIIYSEEEIGALVGTSVEGIKNMDDLSNIGSGILAGGLFASLDKLGQKQKLNIGAAVAGLAVNRFLTVIFKGPSYKKYTYTWLLSPRNEEESKTINNIYNLINYGAAPSKGLGNWNSLPIWMFPWIFQLEFGNNINDKSFSEKMYRFKPAVIESVTLNLTPGGSAQFYHSEYPEAVELTISFMEMEFWLKNYPGNLTGYSNPLGNL